jgi:hypothetical protein
MGIAMASTELITVAHLSVAISNSVAKHHELHQQKTQATPTPAQGKGIISATPATKGA